MSRNSAAQKRCLSETLLWEPLRGGITRSGEEAVIHRGNEISSSTTQRGGARKRKQPADEWHKKERRLAFFKKNSYRWAEAGQKCSI